MPYIKRAINAGTQKADKRKKKKPPTEQGGRLCREFPHVSRGKQLGVIRFEVTGIAGDQKAELLEYFAQCAHEFYMDLAREFNSTP